MAPWVPGPAANTSMPRDNEGDRQLCSPADEYTVSLNLHLKQTCKACSLLDCQKETELNQSSLDLLCASFAFVLSTAALYCNYQGHTWVTNGTENCFCLRRFWGAGRPKMWVVVDDDEDDVWDYSSIQRCRKYEKKGMTCRKGWIKFKLTAITSWVSHTQTILFLLLNACWLADVVHFFILFFASSMRSIALCTMTCDKVRRLLCCILNAPF